METKKEAGRRRAAEEYVAPEREGRAIEIREDYPPIDFALFDDALLEIQRLEGRLDEIERIISDEDSGTGTYEATLRALEEVLAAMQGISVSVEEVQQRLRAHPHIEGSRTSETSHAFYEPFMRDRVDQAARAIAYIRTTGLIPMVAQGEQGSRAAADRRDLAIADARKAAETTEALRAHLRKDTEARLAEFDGLFGLGFLPATRARRLRQHSEIRALHSLLDDIDGFGDRTATIDSAFRAKYTAASKSVQDALDPLLTALKEQSRAEREARTKDDERSTSEAEQKRIRENCNAAMKNIIAWLRPEDDTTRRDLPRLQETLTEAERQVRDFERRLEQDVFGPLGVTLDDEARQRAEPLPDGSHEALFEARERSFRNIREVLRRFMAYHGGRKDMDGVITDLVATMGQTRETAFVGINDSIDDLTDVLTQGEVSSVFNRASPDGAWRSATSQSDIGRRQTLERALGFGERDHPVYAALGTASDEIDGPSWNYGPFHLAFSLERLRDRAICTLGDSMNTIGIPKSLSAGGFLPERESIGNRQLTLDHGLIAKALLELDERYEPKRTGPGSAWFEVMNYVEVQIIGRLSLADAKGLVLSRRTAAKRELETLRQRYPNVAELSKTIQRLRPQLPFTVLGEATLSNRDQHDYARWFQI